MSVVECIYILIFDYSVVWVQRRTDGPRMLVFYYFYFFGTGHGFTHQLLFDNSCVCIGRMRLVSWDI